MLKSIDATAKWRATSHSRWLFEVVDVLDYTGCAPWWSGWRNSWLAHCPGNPEHELSLCPGENGSVEIQCSGCGSDCCRALGMPLFSLSPSHRPRPRRGRR